MYWDDLIGKDEAVRLLRAAASKETFGGAILLLGPDGVGKRTLARLFAQAVLCRTKNRDSAPCGRCKSCKSFKSGNHPDFLALELGVEDETLDLAKDDIEIKIEPVRRLEQRIYRSGFDSPNRVVFIPFIHKMNINAANAFLKTLEEPPEGTVIILTASGEDDLLPTIKSRCVRLTINPLPIDALARFIVETLGVPAADAQRQAVASAGRIGVALEADKGRLALSDFIETSFARALETRSVRDLTASLDGAIKAACEAKEIKPEGHALRGQILEFFPLIAQCLRYALRTTLTPGYDAPLPDGWKRAVVALSRGGVDRIMAVEKALTRASHGVSRYVRPSLCLRYVARRLAACGG